MVQNKIFIDKIKLAGALVSKEFNTINMVNHLKSMVKFKQINLNNVADYNEWFWSWQNISELYDFLKNDYLEPLKKADKELYEDIIEIMDNYDKETTINTYPELKRAYNGILKMMALSKFHDVARTSDNEGDFIAEET